MTMLKKVIATSILSFFLIACLTPNSYEKGSRTLGSSIFEEYFIEKGRTQYFIKPLTFADQDNNKIIVDFTFRTTPVLTSVIVASNFSIICSENNLDSMVVFLNSKEKIILDSVELFYKKPYKKNKYFHRYGSKFSTIQPFVDISELVNGNFQIKSGNKIYILIPTKKSKKKLANLVNMVKDGNFN